jgi:hypothetical protein
MAALWTVYPYRKRLSPAGESLSHFYLIGCRRGKRLGMALCFFVVAIGKKLTIKMPSPWR